MFDKFDIWKYGDNSNCWDYVREFLIIKAGLPPDDLPKFGILPNNKKAMTNASKSIDSNFMECGREQWAIACQYIGNVLIHVGVVDNGLVRHTSKDNGTLKSSFEDYEKMCRQTIYKKHINLCRN